MPGMDETISYKGCEYAQTLDLVNETSTYALTGSM